MVCENGLTENGSQSEKHHARAEVGQVGSALWIPAHDIVWDMYRIKIAIFCIDRVVLQRSDMSDCLHIVPDSAFDRP
jgi:hypothetical protein